ncbi:gluconokinase [Arthrobacter sp. C152]
MSGQVPPLVVMGVSGCGKSTVGALLAGRLGIAFLDGDDFHPAANKEKMAAGIPLTDDDRAPWLARIGQLLAGGGPGADDDGGTTVPPVVACSALKRRYRDLLRSSAPGVVFVHLTGSAALIAARMDARAHEFMPRTLLESQLATLEQLEPDEAHILADISLEPAALVDAVVRELETLTLPA